MDADDGWPKVWDPDQRRRTTEPAPSRARCIAQLLAEADRRGKVEMVHGARQWVRSHEPSKRERFGIVSPAFVM